MNFARVGTLLTSSRLGFASAALAGILAACGGSSAPSASYAPALPTIPSAAAADAAVHTWGAALKQVALPATGCFRATYPSMAWARISCAAAMQPVPPRGHGTPALIGDAADYALDVSPMHISQATGSFPKVTGVTSEKTVRVASLGNQCVCGPNAYTLQLNANFYQTTTACGANASCYGWEQLVYANPSQQGSSIGQLFIQDWRIKAGKTALKCPAKNTGWQSFDGDCYYSSPAVNVAQIPISQLGQLSLSLHTASSGDSGYFFDGKTAYGMKNMQRDFMQLNKNWTLAEFNIFGDCCYSRAVFNRGSKITVSVEADDGNAAAPTCQANAGTTGETNSLSFVTALANPQPQKYPSILFTESGVPGGPPSCDALAAL